MKPLGNAAAKIKLQLFLSHNGFCSRRKAFDLICQGGVKVNHAIVREPSFMVDDKKDSVCVEGKEVTVQSLQYVLLHKPAGYVTTVSDRFAEKTVFDILPSSYKGLFPVGRLDKETEGLLLLTNDGDLAYRLTHPKFNAYKKYFVRISGKLHDKEKQKIEQGVMVEGKKTAPARITHVIFRGDKTELYLTIHEGRKRQIRLMFPQVGHQVVYLKRVAQGALELGHLPIGLYRELTKQEVELLKK